jgi:hypothetical protein
VSRTYNASSSTAVPVRCRTKTSAGPGRKSDEGRRTKSNRVFQANVAEFIPGEAGYSPHWNINFVHTAPGVTLADILASPYASDHYPEALFDDVEDILDAEADGLVEIADTRRLTNQGLRSNPTQPRLYGAV